MVKHIILWKLKDELDVQEKKRVLADMKQNLESLTGVIPGLISMNIVTECLASSNADVMMDSEFEGEDELKCYQTHPAHVKVADTYVRPFVKVRTCIDYEK